jgi:lipoprotein-anchoring transpeptidase ErfK/SrfK
MVTLLKRIETIGVQTKTAIAIESVTPENAHPKDATLKGATVRMAGTGSFAAILQAQEALSYLPAAATVQSYTLDKQDEGWKFTTTLKVYTKDKKTTATPVEPAKTP